MSELISIIVPVYNAEKYLAQCIVTICNQTYENIEIILVDDGSKDNSGLICDEFGKKDSRIKVIHQENGGVSKARNTGIEIATGQYFLFFDSDDFFNLKAVELAYKKIAETQADVVVFDLVHVNENGELLEKKHSDLKEMILDEKEYWRLFFTGYHDTVVHSTNKLFRRELFDNIRFEVGRICEDDFIIEDIISRCKKIATISDVLYYYRIEPNSIIHSSFSLKRFDEMDSICKREFYFLSRGYNDYARKGFYGAVSLMVRAFHRLDLSKKETRKVFRDNKKKANDLFWKINKNDFNISFFVNGLTFVIGIRCYLIFHFNRWQQLKKL